jgi:two-component system chemotaxis response regulator CheB
VISILIVDGVRPQQELLGNLLSSNGKMQVVATAHTCDEALEMIKKLRPNIAVISHQPPKLDGLEATQRIMEVCPVPIIIVTGSGSPGEVASTFDAVDAGALAVLPRPAGAAASALNPAAQELLQTVRIMSEVKVIRRWPKKRREPAHTAVAATLQSPGQLKIVAIGASTGGPLALATILGGLPKDFVAPVVIVQHMANGFMRGFVDWLAPSSTLPIHIATHGEHIRPGHVYMAPDGAHMKVARGNRIELAPGQLENGIQPSVASLFRSVAQVYGDGAAAVLLTGMGRDGAAELLQLREIGAVTFAQDKNSSIVHGMPGEAIKLGAAAHILTPAEISATLATLSDAKRAGEES